MITVTAIMLAIVTSAVISISSVKDIGESTADQLLLLMCQTGERNLDSYFEGFEHSVGIVASFAQTDLKEHTFDDFAEHIDRVNKEFYRIANQTNGVLTYYYRIDPEVPVTDKGFWYTNLDGKGFQEHEVTDITAYDTSDTSQLVWFTVPKATGQPVWLPPYITDNLDMRVLSYDVPIYKGRRFIGVIGIELDYSVMAEQVDNISLYKNGYAFINDETGNIIYHPKFDVTAIAPENMPKVPDGLIGDSVYARYNYDGVEKQAARLELKNGMWLNVSVPVSEINGAWKGIIRKILIVSMILLIIFITVAMQFAGRITRPLRELTKAAEQVSEGNYDVKLQYRRKDEVGILSNTFNELILNLKSYIDELNTLNSQLKEDNITLKAATTKDSLTGVKNRFALRRDYDKYINMDIHIMMLDIDNFKGVNDTYGHSVGDYLLRQTGNALIDIFSDEYSYRYGGDEFMVIVPDISETQFVEKVTALGQKLSALQLSDKKMFVDFSAGYVYGRIVLNDDLRLMLRQADELLYKVKSSGKKTFIGHKYDRDFAAGLNKRAEEAFRHG